MAATLDMNLARRIDKWGGLLLCELLFFWSRLRALLGGPPQPPRRATTPPLDDVRSPAPRRILAMKFYGLGNIAMLVPVLGALRREFPDAEIDFMTMAGNRQLLERSDTVTRVLPVDVSGFVGLVRSLSHVLSNTRARPYDLVIDFEQFVKLSTLLSFLSGAPRRIGFNTDGQRRGTLYTDRVVYTDSEHTSRIFARLLRPLGIDTSLMARKLSTTSREEEAVDDLLDLFESRSPAGPIVTVHVGSGPNFYRVPLKRWPIENFAALCDRIVREHGARVVLTGLGAEEGALVREVLSLMSEPAVDACDRLGVMELVALLKRSSLTIVNDTSVMHLSAMVDTPVAAFFGPTSPLNYGPGNDHDVVFYRDLYCSPCVTNYNLKVSRCSAPVCVRGIPVDQVMRQVSDRYFTGPADSLSVGDGGPAEE